MRGSEEKGRGECWVRTLVKAVRMTNRPDLFIGGESRDQEKKVIGGAKYDPRIFRYRRPKGLKYGRRFL